MKKFSLKLSRRYLKGHPRAGEATDFKEKYLEGIKKHTIRENIEYWSYVIDQVNSGKAYLCIEEWSGIPYYSNPNHIQTLTKLGKQIIKISKLENFDGVMAWSIDKRKPTIDLSTVAENDGLDRDDFIDWFFNKKKTKEFEGIIIHFTDLKY